MVDAQTLDDPVLRASAIASIIMTAACIIVIDEIIRRLDRMTARDVKDNRRSSS